MVNEQQHYAFLQQHYKHQRFEGRNDDCWGRDYSAAVARSSYQALTDHGYTCISQHDSKTGDAVWYDRELKVATYQELKNQYGV